MIGIFIVHHLPIAEDFHLYLSTCFIHSAWMHFGNLAVNWYPPLSAMCKCTVPLNYTWRPVISVPYVQQIFMTAQCTDLMQHVQYKSDYEHANLHWHSLSKATFNNHKGKIKKAMHWGFLNLPLIVIECSVLFIVSERHSRSFWKIEKTPMPGVKIVK